jgi:hypothetical protein
VSVLLSAYQEGLCPIDLLWLPMFYATLRMLISSGLLVANIKPKLLQKRHVIVLCSAN